MEEALSLQKLNQKVSYKYDYDEKRIVGIVLARYDLPLTQSIVDSCYLYWHYNTGKAIDFFGLVMVNIFVLMRRPAIKLF